MRDDVVVRSGRTSNHLFTSVVSLLHSYDSYEKGDEVSERGMTCHHISYLFTIRITVMRMVMKCHDS